MTANFRYLLQSTLAIGLGQWGQQIALGWLVFVLTRSAVQLGAVALTGGVVSLVVTPIGGVAADRYPRRTIILLATVAGAVQAIALALLGVTDDAVARMPPRTTPALRQWAPHAAPNSRTPVTERTGAVAMTTDRDQKRLLEWIGHHPLLTSTELATLVGVPEVAVERRLDWLLLCGVVRVDANAPSGEASAERFVLTRIGLRVLATRDAVPVARYGRFAGVRAFDAGTPEDGGQSRVRHREHLLGVNRVFARLAVDARREGGRLAIRRNEAESTRRFRHDGGTAWVRPDGSGLLELHGERLPFLLEYDRGTLDGGDFAAKLGGYRRYFATEAWRQDFEAVPAVLFVCVDDRAEQRVSVAGRAAAPDLPLLITSEWRYERDTRNPAGLLGPIWRETGTGSVSRKEWPRRRGCGPGRSVCREPSNEELEGENCER